MQRVSGGLSGLGSRSGWGAALCYLLRHLGLIIKKKLNCCLTKLCPKKSLNLAEPFI